MSIEYGKDVTFSLEGKTFSGYIEKEYENSFLICVKNPSQSLEEKYTNRMIVSKKKCQTSK